MYKNVENKVRKIYYFLEIYIMENVSDHVFDDLGGYESDPDNNNAKKDKIRKQKVGKDWQYFQTFNTKDEALEWLNDQETWAWCKNYETDDGFVNLYRCNKIPQRHSTQCDAAFKSLYNNDSMKVTAFKTKNNHNHEEILNTKKQHGFNKETKAFIDDLIQKKVKIPNIIFDALAEAHHTRPEIMMPKNKRQLYNYLDD